MARQIGEIKQTEKERGGRWQKHPHILILGNPDLPRVSIISLNIRLNNLHWDGSAMPRDYHVYHQVDMLGVRCGTDLTIFGREKAWADQIGDQIKSSPLSQHSPPQS